MAQPLEDVYCTLLMSDSYLPGAAVLSHSLRDAGTTKKLAVLVTMETLSADTITRLRALYDYVIPVERLRSPNLANLYLMGRPDLSYAFTKIALWRQTRFRKIVYLDADVVALRALDELFDIEAPFAAAPDIGWPDAFNSGVMVLTPDMSQYWALHTLASSGESFDGADQGLLNQYYENRPWQRLKFTYNTTPNAEYQWEPAYQHYKKDINAVHFIGKDKPWTGHRSGRSSASNVYNELLGHWWSVHDKHAQDEVKDANHPDLSAEPHLNDSELASDNPWDATRSGPPVQSKPEAANFPTQTYNFSDSRDLFKAPGTYPHPPTDMWYQVPNAKPAETLNPIFPWERQPDRARATRVFAEDLPSEPTPAPATSPPTHAFSTVHFPDDKGTAASSGHSSPPKAVDESWQSFQHNNGNAWDNVPGIDNYVRSIMDSQVKRGSPQVLQNMTGTQDISSPIPERRSRRESLILTDFPSAVERPSLPVTPAPQKRPTFWGGERDGTGELPAATGVPDQTEWVGSESDLSSVDAKLLRLPLRA
ncbi:glycosyltransferase family 8 protein [Dothidotthia symphoricarpi CBS 119687]|uniref:glycogenin glucosyltransferase n=1 Tax=Dothidotthia symphoricarpi CBS 119687 TaxID=1392245 RepID=A0A6A6A1L1_9PLEO|nr:glycosyltransferase family 8 protein [Dothidotthia symphoricarpi CBS 119687]KAF2125892.1 glycosyltransferase family 8 protein [Dothidotthia symphoricarpi CBS 119687]